MSEWCCTAAAAALSVLLEPALLSESFIPDAVMCFTQWQAACEMSDDHELYLVDDSTVHSQCVYLMYGYRLFAFIGSRACHRQSYKWKLTVILWYLYYKHIAHVCNSNTEQKNSFSLCIITLFLRHPVYSKSRYPVRRCTTSSKMNVMRRNSSTTSAF